MTKQKRGPRRPDARGAAEELPPYRAQLATPVDTAPDGDDWLHELKYDGHRLGCIGVNGEVRLESRRGNDWTSSFPEVVNAARALPVARALLDGQVAALLPDGRTSRKLLQSSFGARIRPTLVYFVFDLLHLNGKNISHLPLEERKSVLATLLAPLGPKHTLRYSEHVIGAGPRVLKQACALGVEGVVSKRRTAPYRAGRNDAWLETKCSRRQELELGGFRGSREGARASGERVMVAGVAVSSPERVLYPALGLTKLALVQFYAEHAEHILPHVRGRPLTLVRCEGGVSEEGALRTQCKFLRHTSGWHRWVPEYVPRVQLAEQRKVGEYLVIDSPRALLAILNGDIIELHAWNATTDALEQPDRLVFDLDPGVDVPFRAVVAAAVLVRKRLLGLGLESWVKTTGGRGLHVVVPLTPSADWQTCFAFSARVAAALAREHTRELTTTFARQGRHGKILIDYKRNHRGAVAVAAYSTRARPNGSLSIPLTWRELARERAPDRYTLTNLRARLRRLRQDPWHDYWACAQKLSAADV
jgi:bifunctional non-homologous end joining protein LigD